LSAQGCADAPVAGHIAALLTLAGFAAELPWDWLLITSKTSITIQLRYAKCCGGSSYIDGYDRDVSLLIPQFDYADRDFDPNFDLRMSCATIRDVDLQFSADLCRYRPDENYCEPC